MRGRGFLCRVIKNINLAEIETFIDNIEGMSKTRKEFYKKIIKIRYEIIKEVATTLL